MFSCANRWRAPGMTGRLPSIIPDVRLVLDPVVAGRTIRRRTPLRADRAGDAGVAAGVAATGAGGDQFAGDGGRIADRAAARAAHQVHMDVVVVVDVRARREHGGE